MTHIAKGSVWEVYDAQGRVSHGYVGRSVEGNARRIARRGDVVADEVVEALGLDDLEDHTDYDAILEAAKANGAPVTARREDGSVGVKVGNKWATGDEEAWNSGGSE